MITNVAKVRPSKTNPGRNRQGFGQLQGNGLVALVAVIVHTGHFLTFSTTVHHGSYLAI